MNKLTNILSIASIVCIGSAASAQHCTDGVCTLHNHAQQQQQQQYPSYQNTFTNQPRSTSGDHAACRNGQCGLQPEHNCHCNARDCNCAPGTHNQPLYSRDPGLTNAPSPYRQTNFNAPLPSRPQFELHSYRSDSIQWDNNFQRASEAARRSGRPMLVRVTADWCEYCHKMKAETYSNNGIIRDIDSSFVAIDLDADQNRQLVQQMGIQSLPATLVISPDMRIVDREQGFRSAAQLASILRRHLQRAQLDTGMTVAVR